MPEAESRREKLLRVVLLDGVLGIARVRIDRFLRDPPPAAPRGRVEPPGVVPAGDVRRVEELLPRHRVEPDPVVVSIPRRSAA